jgi:3-dehydroquinate dehydratase II
MIPNVLVMQGPNMNRLGLRDPEHYGRQTLADVQSAMDARASELGVTAEHFQSNHEGFLIDWLQERQDSAAGIICNPAGLTNYGYSLRDAINEAHLPTAIVHIRSLHRREPWRELDVFAEIATVHITGAGWRGYLLALEAIRWRVTDRDVLGVG